MFKSARVCALAAVLLAAGCAHDQAAPASEAKVTPAPHDPAAQVSEGDGQQFAIANQSGELVAVEGVLVPDKVTIVDFYADWCAPCKALEKRLAGAIADEPRIAVRKIDVGRADVAEVIERYGVRNLPHVRIYGPDGRLLHDLPGTAAERSGELAREALGSL